MSPAPHAQRLHLGCGNEILPGWINHDLVALPGVDVVHDLDAYPWPFETDQFTEVRLYHVLEHLAEPVRTDRRAPSDSRARRQAPSASSVLELPGLGDGSNASSRLQRVLVRLLRPNDVPGTRTTVLLHGEVLHPLEGLLDQASVIYMPVRKRVARAGAVGPRAPPRRRDLGRRVRPRRSQGHGVDQPLLSATRTKRTTSRGRGRSARSRPLPREEPHGVRAAGAVGDARRERRDPGAATREEEQVERDVQRDPEAPGSGSPPAETRAPRNGCERIVTSP